MEGRLFRKKLKESHLQFGLTPRHLPGSRLPTNANVLSRLLIIRVGRMGERYVKERRVAMKKSMALVAQEIFELWDHPSLPFRTFSLPSHVGGCQEAMGKR